MANSTIITFNIILFFVLISQGCSQCSLKDLHVGQFLSGNIVNGMPEWNVLVSNWCRCVQTNVMLNCTGFESIEPIDPRLLKFQPLQGVCLVNSGKPIGKDVFEFQYAWDVPFPFSPISSVISCS
ncbi:hypothetical protein AAZX31_08G304900 [Glycine max]|uniref:Uncharacterized protein n=2 Tax=Glycine subgen. Soja TaxID=1462606 RepID=A0A0R4J3Z8_SOYBN|nr:uncharacterized protein LOC114422839 [Glycine soja]KAG5017518.1 hypothetical protein JHK85_023654 [Glycine max]KAG5001982.1 hypothetical protein JHK87_023054 [Glycine soja]KAG5027264.1 hypothetical protein JHK86_023178 [Glycine max]KAG5138401.1 hypothetical protein JHK82_023132 [Glycine max]KAH1054075.1 hypothetical protein GYH30_023038 [Glycine max]|eukprot:XP_006586083.1 uncharacterized protein LOC102659821 [Glycine max]